MKKAVLILLPALLLTLSGCEKKKENTENIAELTYRQFYDLMFEDFKNRIEWHKDDFNQEGKSFIALIERGDCETENCGKKVFLKNNSSDQTIRVITKTSYSIPNTLPYIANQFIMAPGDEVYLSCTQLCYGGETYDLAQEIVVAAYQAD